MNTSDRTWGKAALKRMLPSLVTALAAAAVLFAAFSICLRTNLAEPTYMAISSLAEDQPVTFRGATVDGKWLNPSDMLVSAGSWVEDPEQRIYTSSDETPLRLELPLGQERALVFNSGPDEGAVLVEYGEDQMEFDLYSDAAVELGSNYQVPAALPHGLPFYIFFLIAALLFGMFALIPDRSAGGGKTS